MATISEILIKRYSHCLWTVSGDDYGSLDWKPENTIEKPTEETLRALDAEISLELRWDKVKSKRNKLLTSCDWTQIPDSPLSSEQKSEWAQYRQLLRDVPQQQVEPEQVVWPSSPL